MLTTVEKINVALKGAVNYAYSHRGRVDPDGDFVWNEVHPPFKGQPWCGGFSVLAFRKGAGADLMRAAWWYYVPFIRNHARNIGAWVDESSFGANVCFDWQGDGLMDHVGISDPDMNSELFRSIEGNTSSGDYGSQSNGGGVYVRYRHYDDIAGWVDMRTVLQSMYDRGQWDGRLHTPSRANRIAVETVPNPNGYGPVYVREIQQALLDHGYDIGAAGADGILGWKTYAAIVKFQKDNGLEPDGAPGPITRAKLRGHTVFRDVRKFQTLLGTTPDNVVGPITERRGLALEAASDWKGRQFPYGVAEAQRAVGAVADNVWGPKSMDAHDETVWAIQETLGLKTDMVWGPVTSKAFWSALEEGEQA